MRFVKGSKLSRQLLSFDTYIIPSQLDVAGWSFEESDYVNNS
jgi:hypothetical protein